MRNLGTRFNGSNILNVRGGDQAELERACRILCLAMEVSPELGLTPSEERVFDGLTEWYQRIDTGRPYKTSTPAYAYVNLNTGINLLFLIQVPYEGCMGGLIEPFGNLYFVKLVPDSFD